MPLKCDKQIKYLGIKRRCNRPAKWVKRNDARYPDPLKLIYRCGYHAQDFTINPYCPIKEDK